MTVWSPVVELRQYTLRPGQREVMIELFDRELVESQEADGIQVIGQFRDLDRPDRFVWLRGFPDMERRQTALEAFYSGPVWKEHGAAASATMLDVDDVLLLRPLPTPSDEPAPEGTMAITICSLDTPLDDPLVQTKLLAALGATDSPPLAVFVEEPSENTYPALPVRTGEHVVVWIQTSPTRDTADIAHDLLPGLVAPPVQLRLEPTPRSRLR